MAQLIVKDRKKKNGKSSWEYRFEAAKVNGKRRQITKSGFATKKEALEAGTIALAEYNNGGQQFHPAEISFADYLDLWIEKYVMVNLRHKTQQSYKGIIENHLKPNLGHYKLNSLNAAQIQDFVNELKVKGYSKRHVTNIHSTISNALKYAIEPLQYIKQNPAKLVQLPKIEKEPKKRIIVSPENWQKIISRFPFGNKWHIPLIVGYHTGLRISEVFGLTWEDIDLKKGIITVNKQISRIKPDGAPAIWCFKETKTKASVRTVRMDKFIKAVLKAEHKRQKQNRLRYGINYKTYSVDASTGQAILSADDSVRPLCVDEDGSYLTTDSFKYCSRVIHHELKLEFDFHSLRHTHATQLTQEGVDVKNLQTRLGHEKIETTLQTYVHDTPEMEDRTIEILERILGGQK